MKKHLTRSLLCLTAMLLSLASAASAFAQTRTISGKVVDEQGLPVIGASVMLENDNTTGTVTDMDGAYTLDIPGGGAESES